MRVRKTRATCGWSATTICRGESRWSSPRCPMRRTAVGSTSATTRATGTGSRKLNPITGKEEWNGTSILERRRPGQSEARVAHSERDQPELARRVGGLRLQVRRLRPRLPDSQFRSPDRGRDRQGPQVPDLRHHVARHRPFEDHARVGDHRHAAELVRAGLRRHIHRSARTKVGGRRTPDTSTPPPASQASATSSSRSSI